MLNINNVKDYIEKLNIIITINNYVFHEDNPYKFDKKNDW